MRRQYCAPQQLLGTLWVAAEVCCLPLASGELPLKCSSGVAQCTAQVHCSSPRHAAPHACQTYQCTKCTYCGEHPPFGSDCYVCVLV